MNLNHILFAQPIRTIWQALGGDEPRRGRARTFYRDGDNPGAVSLNDEKGCWHDFVTGEGGGVLDLIQRVLGCDRRGALRWLADLNGVPLNDRPHTPPDRQSYARQRKRIEQLAQDVADWEHGLEIFLQENRNRDAVIISWMMSHGIEPGDALTASARGLQKLGEADIDSLVRTYRELPEGTRRPFREAGRSDRENAEAITRTIVSLLSRADPKTAAA